MYFISARWKTTNGDSKKCLSARYLPTSLQPTARQLVLKLRPRTAPVLQLGSLMRNQVHLGCCRQGDQFETTGVFTTACDIWCCVKPVANKTYANFKIHFATENEERICKLTVNQAGFHGAKAATEDLLQLSRHPTKLEPVNLPTLAASTTTSDGPPTTSALSIADTGSTQHFLPVSTPVINCIPSANPIPIHNPNGSIMWLTHEAKLDIPALPTS